MALQDELNDMIGDLPSPDSSQSPDQGVQDTQTGDAGVQDAGTAQRTDMQDAQAPHKDEPAQTDAVEPASTSPTEVSTQATPPTPVQPAPTEQPPPQPSDDVNARINALMEQNKELMRQLNELAKGSVDRPMQQAPKTEQQASAEQKPAFLESEDALNMALDKVENFNALLEKVVERAREEAVEKVLLSIPQLATQLVNQQMTLRMAADEFYKVNADLEPYRNFVGFVTNEIASAHPDYDLRTLLDETAKEVRKRIGLSGMAPSAQNRQAAPPGSPAAAGPDSPAFAHGPGARPGRAQASNINPQEQQILDLLQDL